jgi:hypothetical protein
VNAVTWAFLFGPREWWLGAKLAARELWDDLPGPWYVKILIIIACQLIPGQFDDIAVIAIARAWRRYKTRKAVA